MATPKTLTATVSASNPNPGQTPKPVVFVGGIPVPVADVITALKTLPGYVAGNLQTLKHTTGGVLNWIDG